MVYWFLPYNIYEISAFPLIHAYMSIIRQFQEKFNSRITDIIILEILYLIFLDKSSIEAYNLKYDHN